MKVTNKKIEQARNICAEFFADVIIDDIRSSIILSTKPEHFTQIGNALIDLGFACAHTTAFEDSITACFLLIDTIQ